RHARQKPSRTIFPGHSVDSGRTMNPRGIDILGACLAGNNVDRRPRFYCNEANSPLISRLPVGRQGRLVEPAGRNPHEFSMSSLHILRSVSRRFFSLRAISAPAGNARHRATGFKNLEPRALFATDVHDTICVQPAVLPSLEEPELSPNESLVR